MVFAAELQLAYLCYIEFSLTFFQNYRITAFESFWFSPLKHQKAENQQQKQQQKKKQQKK